MTSWLRTSSLLARPGWAHGWTTAAGPDFRSAPDSAEHAAAVGKLTSAVRLDSAAWVRQIHGGTVLKADGPGCLGEADALWTDRPGLGVVGRSADCPLVLVACDGPRPVWGFAHASWRSTVAGITSKLMAALLDAGADPGACRAVVCPSAGPCCYEVGTEVREQTRESLGKGAEAFFSERGGHLLFDLWRANVDPLIASGVPSNRIRVTGSCTICGPDYPSYRRDDAATGRFAALLGHA